MKLRKLRLLALPLLAGVLSMQGMSPAHATVGVAAGVVVGHVSVSPGVPTGLCGTSTDTTFVFSSTTIAGVFAGAAVGDQYVGTIDVSASGGATGETGAAAVLGTVGSLSGSTGATTVTGPGVSVARMSTLPLTNTYVRVGALVNVVLEVLVTVGGSSADSVAEVAALFVPTTTSGETTSGAPTPCYVTEADFAGVFAGVGV